MKTFSPPQARPFMLILLPDMKTKPSVSQTSTTMNNEKFQIPCKTIIFQILSPSIF